MRLQTWAEQMRTKVPELKDLADLDIVQMAVNKKAKALRKLDREDLGQALASGRKKARKQQFQKDYRSRGAVDKFTTGVGSGMLDTFMGIKQLFGGDDTIPFSGASYKDTKETFQTASEGDGWTGAGEFAGMMSATGFVPAATGMKLATKVANPLLKKATQLSVAPAVGAGYGLTEYVDEGEARGKNVVYGSLFGAGTAAGTQLLKKMGVKAFNAAKKKFANASDAEIQKLADSHGIRLSRGDVTQKAGTKKAEVIAESKAGGLSPFREEQSQDANRIMTGFVDELKKPIADAQGKVNVGKNLQESVKRGYNKARSEAKAKYDRVDKLSGDASIKPNNAIEMSKKYENEIANSVLGSETNPFTKITENLSKKNKTFKDLRQARSDLGKAAQKAEDGGDKNLSRQLKDVKKGVEFDIKELVAGPKDKSRVTSMSDDKVGEAMAEMEFRQALDSWDETLNSFGEYKKTIKEMASYVRNHGSKKDPKTGMLGSEHVPKSKFGESSDEVAANIGMDESEFMEMLSNAPKPVRAKKFDQGFPADWGDVQAPSAKYPDKGVKQAYKDATEYYKKNVVPYTSDRALKKARNTNEPSQIYKSMINEDNPDRAANFYKALDKTGRQSVEFEIINRALKKAKVETPTGDNYSPAQFSSYLSKMDDAGEIFFFGSNKKKAQGIKRLMRAAVRAGQYMENPPTGNRELIAKEALKAKATLGLMPLLTQFEKFFWTGKGKNFLLAASELEPNSIKMQKLISKIYDNLPKSAVMAERTTED